MREQFTYGDYKHYGNPYGGKHWFYFRDQKISLLTPAKCGTSSVKQFIWMNELEEKIIRIEQHQATGELYATTREPVSRFRSLWRSKCRDQTNINDKRVYGMSPNELMTHIENGAKDLHWTPQLRLLGKLGPTLIPLDMLSSWWQNHGLGELGRFNATKGDVEIDDKLKTRILTFYACDVELYNRAAQNTV